MRVLVLSGATYGDPARRRVFDRIAARGVEVVLAVSRRGRYPFFPADEIAETPWPTPGVTLVRLETILAHETDTHIIMKGVPRLIRDVRPDVIHCAMEPWSVTCLEAFAVAGFMRSKPVFGVQAAEALLDQGGVPLSSVRRRLFRHVVSRCDFFVGWNSLVLEAASRNGLNGQPVCLAPAVGTDVNLFRPPMERERARLRSEMDLGSEGDFLIGFAGRFVEEKGIEDLVVAMDGVTTRRPQARLILMGTGTLEERLRCLAACRPWLHLVGATDRSGVARFMRALDLLVLPSRTTVRIAEQFGLVLVEAMASGVPVIGSTCGAIPEVVGDAGWIVEQGNPPALHDCILRVFDSDAERKVMSERARERAVARFSDEAVAGALVGTWRAALARRRP